MTTEVKIYKIKEIIRHNESGSIDYEQSLNLIEKLAATASYHREHNILIDMRDTVLEDPDWHTLLDLATHLVGYKNLFKNKIANIVPDNEKRLQVAKIFRGCLHLHGFDYQFFTDYESAIEWLSDTKTLHQSTD